MPFLVEGDILSQSELVRVIGGEQMPPSDELRKHELEQVLKLLAKGWARAIPVERPPLFLRLLGARPRYCLGAAIAKVRFDDPDAYERVRGPILRALGFRSIGELVVWNDTQLTVGPVLDRVERAIASF